MRRRSEQGRRKAWQRGGFGRAVSLLFVLIALVAASPAAAATVAKTWTFAADDEGLVDAGSSGQVNFLFVSGDGSPAGSVAFTTTIKNLAAASEFGRRATTGETWESWGVPAGSTVTGVQITAWSERTFDNTKLSSHSIAMRIVDSGGATVHSAGDLITANPGTTVDGTWQAGTAGTSRAVDAGSQASSTDVRLELEYTVTTSGGGGSASVDQRFDQIQLTITYTAGNAPPSVSISTPANGSSIGGPAASYSVTGTASDSDGTVSNVQVQIQRGTDYWSGSSWTTTASWLTATGTTSWSYSWSWTNDMDATSVTLRARATDNGGAQTTATNTTTVDTRAPQISSGVRFQTPPTSADTSFTLLSNWIEANPGTPRFAYNLNNTGYTGFVNGSAGNASSRAFAVTLTGSDYFTGIKSDHTDTFSNGPTTSEDLGPFYVLPLTPSAPTLGSPTTSSLAVTIVPNASEAGTGMLYAIRCHDAGGTPTGFWVANSGRQCTAAAADWQTLATWGTPVTVGGLSANTTYQFSVAAGNPKDATPTTGERSASAYGATGSGTTSGGNTAPTVSITTPTNGASYNQGSSVTFTGSANDAQDGDLTAGLAWTSSIDGAIGTGGSFTRSDLSVGTHTITASVTDSGSLTGQAQVTITINATAVTPGTPTASANSCSQVTVSAPFSGDGDADSTTAFRRGTAPGGPFNTDVCIGVTGASPRTCIDTTVAGATTYYYQVDFTDLDGVNGTDPQVTSVTTPACAVNDTTVSGSSAVASSCNQIAVTSPFTGDANGNGSINVQYNTTNSFPATVACATVAGPSPRQCLVTGLSASTGYYVRIDWTDADGVNGTDPEVLGPVSTPACAADSVAPTLVALSPTDDAVVGGTDTVKVQVFDGVGLRGTNPVEWSVDGAAFTPAGVATNANYSCGTGCAVYEFDWDTTALANGPHYVSVRATDAASNVSLLSIAVVVQNTGTRASGAGTLLRRSHGSQLCIDCHNLPTHSSQSTSAKYGSWAVDCLACHTPHRTRNLYLVREEIRTPSSGRRPVRFEGTGGAVANSAAAGAASYANEDNATQADGPCQACHTKTKNAGGQARWRNAAAGGNLDTHYGNGVATSRCTGCHTHSAGFSGAGGACDSCHNAPPSVGKHGSHDQVGTTPTDYTSTTSTATSTQYGFACAKCHTGTHFSDSNTPHTVEVVFDTTAAPANPGGAYAPDGGSQASDPGVNGDGWYWSNGTCSNLYCHSNASPVGSGASSTTATVTWNQVTALSCASCHSNQARTDSGNAAHLSTAHGKHVQSTSGETGSYSFTCDECHAGTIRDNPNLPWNLAAADLSDKTKHVDGVKSWAFSTTATAGSVDQSGGSYSAGTCSNLYCHSQGRSTSSPFGGAPNASPAWNGGSTTCESCHGGNAGATSKMATNAHAAHMNQASYLGSNFMCYRCHQDTVSSGSDTTLNTISFHVNGARNVNLADGGSYASLACSNSYCHSSGQATAVIQYYNPPNWDSGTTLANDCKACHGRHSDNAFTSLAGEPNYTSNGANGTKANSHKKHVTAASDCGDCHNDTSTTGTSIVASSVRHLDGVRDVAISATWDNNGGTKYDNYTPGTKTCASVKCHVNAGASPVWGGTVTCLNCHGVTGAETNDLGASFWNNLTVATINTTEWTYSGHGKTSGQYDVSLNPAANLPTSPTAGTSECLYCHDDGIAHKLGSNPFRLRGASVSGGTTGVYSTAAPNAPCLNCHATGSFGVTPSGQVNKNGTAKPDATHDGAKHTAATQGGRFCWDCHDPHGERPSNTNSAGNNIYMIGRLVNVVQDGTYGYRGASGTERSVEFYNVTPATASDTGGSAIGRIVETTTALGTSHLGLCQACHDETTSPSPATAWTRYWESIGYDDPNGTPSTDRYRSGRATAPLGHNTTSYCISCHSHADKFKGKGGGPDCRGCHGTQQQGSRRAVDADFSKNSHHVGNGSSMGGTLNNFDCVVCHAEGTVISGPTADCPSGTSGSTCTDPSYHTNGTIDLRDVDSTTNVFVYDKAAVASSAGAAGNWNSSNQLWREWTSGVDEAGGATLPANAGLDRFCISCHDADGASQIANFRESTSQTATNPFADTTITNNYDQADRTRVTDIASRVHVTARTAAGGNVTATDRDNGYAPAGVMVRGADGRNDPPEGVFSRHAIRGMSTSVYGGTNANLDTTTYWNRSKVTWASNSVMGCADCHTSDGANTTSGNAHGSDSEYLLKDASGLATEGSSPTTYGCAQCHNSSNYVGGTHLGMSSNTGNCPTDSTASVGTARVSSDGNIYGYMCGSCHGGGAASKSGATFPTGATGVGGFGAIHGTSQIFGITSATGTARPAYRFTNGNAMRYYNPGDWTTNGSGRTCYTIGTADSWSACTQHSGGRSATIQSSMQRPLNY